MPLMYRSCCGFACGLTFGVLIWKPGSFGRSPFSRYFSRVPIVSEDIAATRVYPPARTHERVLPPLPSRPRQATSLRHCRLFSYFLFSLLLLLFLRIFLLRLFHRTAPHSTAQHSTAVGRCVSRVSDPRLPPRRPSWRERPAGRSLVSEIQIFLTSFKYFRTPCPSSLKSPRVQGYLHSQVSQALKVLAKSNKKKEPAAPKAMVILKQQTCLFVFSSGVE